MIKLAVAPHMQSSRCFCLIMHVDDFSCFSLVVARREVNPKSLFACWDCMIWSGSRKIHHRRRIYETMSFPWQCVFCMYDVVWPGAQWGEPHHEVRWRNVWWISYSTNKHSKGECLCVPACRPIVFVFSPFWSEDRVLKIASLSDQMYEVTTILQRILEPMELSRSLDIQQCHSNLLSIPPEQFYPDLPSTL